MDKIEKQEWLTWLGSSVSKILVDSLSFQKQEYLEFLAVDENEKTASKLRGQILELNLLLDTLGDLEGYVRLNTYRN